MKKCANDLKDWLWNNFLYILFFWHVYYKASEIIYKARKPQAFIIIFAILSCFLLALFGVYVFVSQSAFLGDCEFLRPLPWLLAIFSDCLRFLVSTFFKIVFQWVQFIEDGDNLIVVLGVVVSLFCFIFNAQKNIAGASTTFSDWRFLSLIAFLCIPNVLKLAGFKICFNTWNEFVYYLVLLLLFWAWCWYAFHIKNLIYRVNVVNLFTYVLHSYRIYREGVLLYLKPESLPLKCGVNSYCKAKLFRGLNHIVLSIYQVLLHFITNDLLGVFQHRYREWLNYSDFLNVGDSRKEQNDDTIHFLEQYSEEYAELYNVTVRCQYMLIKSLYDHGYVSEGYQALKDFFPMCPYQNVDMTDGQEKFLEMKRMFLSTLCELGLYFYNNNISLTPIYENVKGFVSSEVINDIIAVYRVLLIKASEKQDVKVVIALCYNLMQTVKQTLEIEQGLPIVTVGSENAEKRRYRGRILYIYLCAVLKAIELGHKDIVSFLIKFTVSEFNGTEIETALKHLHENLPHDFRFDSHEIGDYTGIKSFNINSETHKYCFEKMVILLKGQQKYIHERGVRFNPAISGQINVESFLTEKWLYVLDKLYADQYNLLWMKDTDEANDFRERLKDELKRANAILSSFI